ncbi:MAG TPA: hypothetical protein VM324_12120 [Egibacteraceae bacterium]|nr:hypothetical protein [Egibacteraceae bacterium]
METSTTRADALAGHRADLARVAEQQGTTVDVARRRGRRGAPLALRATLALAVLCGALLVTATLGVGPLALRPRVVALELTPTAVAGCAEAAGTVTVDRSPRRGPLPVALVATSAAADAPEEVRIQPGKTAAAFVLPTQPVAEDERVEIQATVNGATATAHLDVGRVDAAALQANPSAACRAAFAEHHGYGAPRRTGMFDAERIPEASGLAASHRNPGWLYLVDDERPREVWAMRTDGSDLRPIPLDGFVGRDTEALAVGPCGPGNADPCVYVGDIGDNLGTHADVGILRFPEPDLAGPLGPVRPDAVRVRYPDGPVDAEALLVDEAGVPYVVTKEPGPDGSGAARLFAADGFADGVLVALGEVPLPEPLVPLLATVVGVVVTGGDHRDGRVVLRTYDHVVEFVAPDPSAPLSSFPSWPSREVPAAREPQAEAVAFAAGGCGYYTVGEQVGDVWFVPCLRD